MYEKENNRTELKHKTVTLAMNAFATKGIKGVTMDDIAMGLGISKRTLYEMFEDKEELLIACMLEHQKRKNVFVNEVISNSVNVLEVILKCYKKSVEDYHKTNVRFLEEIKKYPKVCELMNDHKKKNSNYVISFFRKGVEQGLFRADIKFDIVHDLLHEQIDMLIHSETFKKYSFLEVYESIVLIFVRGISTDKGIGILENFLIEYNAKSV